MPSTKQQSDPKRIGAAELAKKLGTEPTELRKFLRAEGKKAGRGKRYEFTAQEAAQIKRRWNAS